MIPIDTLPDFDWNDTALEEMSVAGQEMIEQSQKAVQVGDVAVAGLIYENLLGPPWFWFALSRNVGLRELLDFRRLKDEIPIGALTAINSTKPEALRFADLYGFEMTEDWFEVKGVTYLVFRRT